MFAFTGWGKFMAPADGLKDRLKRSYQKKFSGDGSPYTNLIHLNDIVSAVNLAINQNLQGIYNLCNDFHIPRRNFYDLLCKQHNIPTIQWDDQLAAPHGGNKRVDNQKMKETGFAFFKEDNVILLLGGNKNGQDKDITR